LKITLFVIFLTLSFSSIAQSKRNDLLYCLGQEEKSLHLKKRTGPQYFLNQYFINEAASTGVFKLKRKFYNRICIDKEFPPSIGLMKNILIHEKDIFKNVKADSSHLQALYVSGLESLVETAPHIFFQFLSIIQSHTRYAHCFRDNIPELHKMMQNYQYLEEEMSTEQLLSNKKNIKIIFDKLKSLEVIYERCENKYLELQKKIKTNSSP
jgi:hypothetical protein